jgi:hypothetical protein
MKHNTICATCFLLLCCFSATVWHKEHRLHLKIYLFSQISLATHPQLTYPAGFQGWTASTTPGGSYATTGTLGADRVLVANSTAATPQVEISIIQWKNRFLNTGSLDLTIGLAIKTTGKTAHISGI